MGTWEVPREMHSINHSAHSRAHSALYPVQYGVHMQSMASPRLAPLPERKHCIHPVYTYCHTMHTQCFSNEVAFARTIVWCAPGTHIGCYYRRRKLASYRMLPEHLGCCYPIDQLARLRDPEEAHSLPCWHTVSFALKKAPSQTFKFGALFYITLA